MHTTTSRNPPPPLYLDHQRKVFLRAVLQRQSNLLRRSVGVLTRHWAKTKAGSGDQERVNENKTKEQKGGGGRRQPIETKEFDKQGVPYVVHGHWYKRQRAAKRGGGRVNETKANGKSGPRNLDAPRLMPCGWPLSSVASGALPDAGRSAGDAVPPLPSRAIAA